VPIPVENLRLVSGSHSIMVYWWNALPTLHSSRSVIEWVQVQNGKSESIVLSEKIYPFLIKDIDACAEYNVSVRTMNMKGERSRAVTGCKKTETDGKYLKTISCSVCDMGVDK
jgi:hypothetical protein